MTTFHRVACRTAGLRLELCSTSARWIRFAREAFGGHELGPTDGAARPDVRVVVEVGAAPFPRPGMRSLTRGAWSDGARVLLEDACTSGVDLLVMPGEDHLDVEARYRPSWSTRALGRLAPDRAVLLLRDALLLYPAMWWAGRSGAAPLHVSAVRVANQVVALAGPGGVGKSTLVHAAMAGGAWPVSDNLCIGTATQLAGVLEPLRVEGGTGRKMPHGRREIGWLRRLAQGEVEQMLLLRRGGEDRVEVGPMDPRAAADVVVGGTYAAGELRRFWAFAATVALGTGIGPVHPPVDAVAAGLCSSVPCHEVRLPDGGGTRLDTLVAQLNSPASRPNRG